MKLLVLLLLVWTSPLAGQCLTFEPDTVRLSGTLTIGAFPGRPNYEDTVKGDEPEHPYILALASKICVRGDSTSDLNRDDQSDIQNVQLIFLGPLPRDIRSFVGKPVVLAGKLTTAISGHHHTPVLLIVSRLLNGPSDR